jgi:hypothetical protein
MRALRFLLLSALVVFVGLPCLFLLLVLGLSMFGVVFGIGAAIIGIMLAVIKLALIVIIPVALLVWLFRMFFGRAA